MINKSEYKLTACHLELNLMLVPVVRASVDVVQNQLVGVPLDNYLMMVVNYYEHCHHMLQQPVNHAAHLEFNEKKKFYKIYIFV